MRRGAFVRAGAREVEGNTMNGGLTRAAGGRAASSLRAATMAAALALVSGCWLQVGADAGHTRFNVVETGLTRADVETLQVDWSVTPGGVPSEPMVRGDRVYVTRTYGENWPSDRLDASVLAFDAGTGSQVWERRLVEVSGPGSVPNGTPVTFVGDELWTSHYGFSVGPSGPTCSAADHVLDPATGVMTTEDGAFSSAVASAAPVVARVVTELQATCEPSALPGRLEVDSRRPDGSGALWTAPLSGYLGSYSPAPTLAGDRVYVADAEGAVGTTLRAYATAGCGAATCAPLWSRTYTRTAISTPVARDTGPVIVLAPRSVQALDQDTGEVLWQAQLTNQQTGLALAGDTVFVTTAAPLSGPGHLQAFEAGGCGAPTCSPLWSAPLGNGGSEPVVAGGVVYTVSSQGVLAFDAAGCGTATCSPLVTVPLPHTAHAELAVAQGRLFVATGTIDDAEDARLTALSPA
jgi:outer membrane protein assembly factor BamB